MSECEEVAESLWSAHAGDLARCLQDVRESDYGMTWKENVAEALRGLAIRNETPKT